MQETAIEEQKTAVNAEGLKNCVLVPTNLLAFAEGYFEAFLGMVLHCVIFSVFLIWRCNLKKHLVPGTVGLANPFFR